MVGDEVPPIKIPGFSKFKEKPVLGRSFNIDSSVTVLRIETTRWLAVRGLFMTGKIEGCLEIQPSSPPSNDHGKR